MALDCGDCYFRVCNLLFIPLRGEVSKFILLLRIFRTLVPALTLIAGLFSLYLLAIAHNVQTVSFVFLLGYPFIAGGVIVAFRPKNTFQSLGRVVLWTVGIMVTSIFLTFLTGDEGLICIAMGMIPILGASLSGGIVYLSVLRWKAGGKETFKVVSLPVVAMIIVGMVPAPPKIYEISNSIVIDAPPDVVFQQLKSIPDIKPHEIPTRMSHLLGVPKPTAAVWEDGEDGAVRHSYWGKDVHFLERITNYESDRLIAWEFDFPEGWIANGIEDPHVKVGGQYFDVLSGEYSLEDLNGKTRLTLKTWTYDNSSLGYYAQFWHNFFFEDFHEVILILVKNRLETS